MSIPGASAKKEFEYFTSHEPEITNLVMDATSFLDKNVARLIAKYVVDNESFGEPAWMKYFNIKVEGPKLPFEPFYQFWHGPDPIDPTLLAYQTHLPPVLVPSRITFVSTNRSFAYNLQALGECAKTPGTAKLPLRFSYSEELRQHEKTTVQSSYWVVMRKNVVARSESYARQKKFIERLNANTNAGYESAPSMIDVATSIFARHASTGEYHFGNNIGQEGCWTYTTCEEERIYPTRTSQVIVGGTSSLGSLDVHSSGYIAPHIGIALMKRFV